MRRRPGGREAVPFFCALPYGTDALRSNKKCSQSCLDRDRVARVAAGQAPAILVTNRDWPLSVLEEDVVASELVTQYLNQLIRWIDSPALAELQQRPRIAAGVLQGDRAGTTVTTADIGQPAHTITLECFAGDLHPQAFGQAGTCFFQAHHALGAQAQAAGEVIVADL